MPAMLHSHSTKPFLCPSQDKASSAAIPMFAAMTAAGKGEGRLGEQEQMCRMGQTSGTVACCGDDEDDGMTMKLGLADVSFRSALETFGAS